MITHRLQEVQDLCDQVVILRNGVVELNEETKNVSISDMVEAMVGRKFSYSDLTSAPTPKGDRKELLRIKNISYGNKLKDVSFTLYPGEVVGIAGLLGSGRTELLKIIYGLLKPSSGEVIYNGETLGTKHNPSASIQKRICFVPENRRKDGIIHIQSIHMNLLIEVWNKFKGHMFIHERESAKASDEMIQNIDIKCVDRHQEIKLLSGGNQQKAVLGKGLFIEPQLLLLDDPTAGIDVDSKNQIAAIIRDIANQGSSILYVSSEMDQIARLCDRVIILKNGTVSFILDRRTTEISENSLLNAIQ